MTKTKGTTDARPRLATDKVSGGRPARTREHQVITATARSARQIPVRVKRTPAKAQAYKSGDGSFDIILPRGRETEAVLRARAEAQRETEGQRAYARDFLGVKPETTKHIPLMDSLKLAVAIIVLEVLGFIARGIK